MNNFFSHPMRTFWGTACFFGLLGALGFFAVSDYISFHQIMFLSLLPAAAYGGFIIVAIPDWTNYKRDLTKFYWMLFGFIALAFGATFFGVRAVSAVLVVFWLVLFAFVAYLLWRDRNDNNFTILFVLALFAVTQAAFAYSGEIKYLNAQIHINVAAIVVVSFRVSTVLGAEALKSSNLKDPVFIPNGVYKNLVATFALCYAFSQTFLDEKVSGFIALGVGLVLLAKLKELHYHELWKHYIAIYYLLETLGGLGYLYLGASQVLTLAFSAAALHVIAICYMFGAIMMIFVIAGLRHSGFEELHFGFLAIFAILAVFGAGILRGFFSNVSLVFYIYAPAALIFCAFVAYLSRYLPIFLTHPFSEDPD